MVPRSVEAAVVGAAGAGLGYVTGRAVGAPIPAAVIGGASGIINGWRRIYCWITPIGVAGFVLDHTWALATTLGGLASHTLSALRGAAGYQPADSERRGRHVYTRGFQVRRGYAMAMGNVVTGAGDPTTGEMTAHRRHILDDHEEVHIWQARLLGPIYPVVYVGWSVLAAPVGLWRWWRSGRQGSWSHAVDALSYRANPFERWAYAHQARQATLARSSRSR